MAEEENAVDDGGVGSALLDAMRKRIETWDRARQLGYREVAVTITPNSALSDATRRER